MPRYHYSQSPAALRQTKTKQFEFSVTTENAGSTQLENTFTLPQEYNIRQVRLVGFHYPYQSPAERINDAKCITWGADSYATVPYVASHSFVGAHGDQPFSIAAWVYLPALHASETPIFCHGTEYCLSLTATLELQLRVGPAANCIAYTSTEVVSTETWTFVTASYAGTGLVTDITMYIDGAACGSPVDASSGAFVAMTNGSAPSYLAYDGTNYAGADVKFGDLVLFNRVLSAYEATYLYNSGACKPIYPGNPIAVSRYPCGDAEGDTDDTTLVDIIGSFDAAVTAGTATITEDAPSSIANVAAGDQSGSFLVSLVNLSEISTYTTCTASILGQTFNNSATYAIGFEGLPDGGVFDFAPESDETAIALENACLASTLQVRVTFVGADHDAQVSVLPRLTWGGAAKVVLQISYYET